MKRVYIQTYGCPANKYDTEIMMGLLEEGGYELSSLEEANYVIVNSCGVKKPTEDRIMHILKKYSSLDKKLIVAGCLSKINSKRIKREVPNFAAILDPQSVHRIVKIINRIENGQDKIIEFSEKSLIKPKLPKTLLNPPIGILQISEGCNLNCSYCCVRFAGGKLQCYPPKDIIKEAKNLVNKGCKELWVTSQDNGSYNSSGITLPKLLNGICEIEGWFFVRVGMMNPQWVKLILDELIEAYKNKKIFKFLHLPLESGSDKILRLMNRGYKVKDFLEIVERFREKIPSLTLATDIIVGFPSENDQDFEETIEVLKEVKPDVVNLSKFGPRPGTKAAKMEQLDPHLIKQRSKKLHKLIKTLKLQRNENWLDWNGEVLVDERRKGSFITRNFAYKPIVIPATRDLFGKFGEVKVLEAKSNYLTGRLMN